MKAFIVSTIIAALISAALIGGTTNSSFAQEQAPILKEGDTWQFNITPKGLRVSTSERLVGVYELAVSQGAVKIYEISGNQKTEIDISPDGPGGGLLTYIGKHERRPSLKFPLSVGQKWTYGYETKPAGAAQSQKRNVEVVVISMEQVTTPAGSFKAYKLVRKETWMGGIRRPVPSSSSVTYFYSPDTRSVVKSSSVNENTGAIIEAELIKFTPGN